MAAWGCSKTEPEIGDRHINALVAAGGEAAFSDSAIAATGGIYYDQRDADCGRES